jgi:hypothetical protein
VDFDVGRLFAIVDGDGHGKESRSLTVYSRQSGKKNATRATVWTRDLPTPWSSSRNQ